MSTPVNRYILQKLNERKSQSNLRSLRLPFGVDFTSNDYLGLALDGVFQQQILEEITVNGLHAGSSGSRLLTGNNTYIEELEKEIAEFHCSEDALFFNSGFDANYGILSALPYRGQTVFYDELVHASIHDGLRNSRGTAVPFSHNNWQELEKMLSVTQGVSYVVVESLYSMDGDFAPLYELADVCKKYEAALIVDEAHAVGLFGRHGAGRVMDLGLETEVFARIITYGKAFGASGATIAGSLALKTFLLNYCRPLIYSTAPSPYVLAAVRCAYRFLQTKEADEKRKALLLHAREFRDSLKELKKLQLLPAWGPVQPILCPGNDNVLKLSAFLQQSGIDARAIKSPTVPAGKERIRICLHSFNTPQQVAKLTLLLLQFDKTLV